MVKDSILNPHKGTANRNISGRPAQLFTLEESRFVLNHRIKVECLATKPETEPEDVPKH